MSEVWPLVPLGEVLTSVSRSESVVSTKEYRLLGIRLDGGGPFLRETKLGSQSSATTLSQVQAGDFIYSRLFAWRGAFGIINASLDGCYVSGEFPTFHPIPGKLDTEFLRLWFRLPGVLSQVEAVCTGSTPLTRNRFKEHFFLKMPIPLPPLSEQRRIIARIEELAAKIEEAREIRREAVVEVAPLLAAEELKLWPEECSLESLSLEAVTNFLARGRQSEQGASNHYLIKTQHVQMGHYLPSNMTLAPHVAAKVTADAVAQFGDILIACSAAGCLGRVARYTDPQNVASTDTHVAIARANPALVMPDYLYAYLKGARGQIELRSREKGDWTRKKVGFRLTELNLADLRKVPVPLPPLSEQERIVAYLDSLQAQVDALNQLQAETAAELDALLPSVLDRAFSGRL